MCTVKTKYTIFLILFITHPTAKVSEEANTKLPARNMWVQLFTPYFDPESHNTWHYRWTERRMDDIMMPIANHTV